MKHALTIAGSDCSGGAGIQADLKTFSALGCYGMSVITAVTAQNTQTVTGVMDVTPAVIAAQLDAIFSDIRVDAVKVGMVSVSETIHTIAERLRNHRDIPLVVDPVMVSKSGYHLLREEAVGALAEALLPLAMVVTPNIPEAEILAGMAIQTTDDINRAAARIRDRGARNVLIKGGHLPGAADDRLYADGKVYTFTGKRIDTKNTHGTGCTFSSAIAAFLAQGETLPDAVDAAKRYIQAAIEHAAPLGHGHGPVHHFYAWWKENKEDEC